MILIDEKEVEKLFKLFVQGNIERTGEEILKELNQNGFYIVKMTGGLHKGKCPTCSCEPIKTDLNECQ